MTARTHQTRKQSRQKASTPNAKQSPGAQPHVEESAEQTVQRIHEMPPALLRVDEVMKMQGMLGNQATKHMLKQPSASSPHAGNAIQRNYTGELIVYNTIESEKDTGEIATGWKLHSTLTKRVRTFQTALESGNQTTILAALNSIKQRLTKDSAKKLKKPKTISVVAQQKAATTFFAKWKRITQEHIDYLTQNGGTAVTDFQQAYGVTQVEKKKEKEKRISSEDESTSDSIEITTTKSKKGSTFSFDAPPWDSANQAEVKTSGKGGAVIVSFPGGNKIAVKRNSPGEVLGARMAQESGLTMPRTRLAEGTENDDIDQALLRLGAGKLASPYTVVEYVPGGSVTQTFGGKGKVDKGRVMALAASMGRWFAFNLITGDNDNFNRLVTKGSPLGGVNTGNYLVSSESPNEVTAIDQTVMAGNPREGQGLQNTGSALEAILEGDGLFALNIANDIVAALGNPTGFDGDSLIPVIMKAAKEQLEQSTAVLTRSKILELAGDLEINKLNEVIDRVTWIASQVH